MVTFSANFNNNRMMTAIMLLVTKTMMENVDSVH